MTIEEIKCEYYSELEVAKFMELTLNALRQRIYNGHDHPPFVKIGVKRRFPKREFHAWLKSRPLHREIKTG